MTARIASIPLLIWAASLGACTPKEPALNEVQREDAERQALIDAMERHPALRNDQAGAQATGQPIHVPTTVPPKAGNAAGHDHDEDPQHPHRN
jgi:hypothetical protein